MGQKCPDLKHVDESTDTTKVFLDKTNASEVVREWGKSLKRTYAGDPTKGSRRTLPEALLQQLLLLLILYCEGSKLLLSGT